MPGMQRLAGRDARAPVGGRGFRARLGREVAEALRCLGDELTPDAVHAARLALKRARALARVGSAWAAPEAAAFNREAQTALRVLGAWRDADVQRQTASHVGRNAPPELRADLRAFVRQGGGPMRGDARGRMAKLKAALANLQAMASAWPRTPRGGFVAGIARVIRRARRGWKRAGGTRDARARHRWRRREKERLHAAQLLASAWPAGVRARRRVNRRLDATLGEERDLVLLWMRLRSGATGRATVSGRIHLGHRIKRLQRQADALGRRLHAGRA
jgi:CHAD domain-containing protein